MTAIKNVFSVTNAGKRWYGENHWFWAVWIGVGSEHQWDESHPTEQGFCESKTEARRAAWSAIRSRGQSRAYNRGVSWASSYLHRQMQKDDRPRFSRCSVGKQKWFWVVLTGCGDFKELARGFAKSADAAHKAAIQAVGDVNLVSNEDARNIREKEAALRRKRQAPSDSDSTAILEFVYECRGGFCTKYRIVKKTKKRIYVDCERYREDKQLTGEWYDWHQKTFVLDREAFETTGKATPKNRWYSTCYVSPDVYYAERESYRMSSPPACLIGLDVPPDADVDQIKSAYHRLAKQTHPDSGGDPDKFKQVRQWYEQALALGG